jgi:hypothetical protein
VFSEPLARFAEKNNSLPSLANKANINICVGTFYCTISHMLVGLQPHYLGPVTLHMITRKFTRNRSGGFRQS